MYQHNHVIILNVAVPLSKQSALLHGLKLWIKSLKGLPKSDILTLINWKDKGAEVRKQNSSNIHEMLVKEYAIICHYPLRTSQSFQIFQSDFFNLFGLPFNLSSVGHGNSKTLSALTSPFQPLISFSSASDGVKIKGINSCRIRCLCDMTYCGLGVEGVGLCLYR